MERRAQAVLAGFLAVAAGLAGLLPERFRAGRVAEWKLRDAHVLLTPARAPARILIVAADEKATEAFPEPLLFWHGYYARAIERLAEAGAKVVALDMVFAVPVGQWAPGLDARLAAAAAKAEEAGIPVLVGTAPLARQKEQERAVPLNLLASSLGRLVDVSLTADEDDFVRHVQLTNEEGLPALAAQAVALYTGRDLPRAKSTIEIRHAGPAGTAARVSLADLLPASDAQVREWASGRIVLIGADLPMDRHATPYYAFHSGHLANTAGVEVHASAIATLLDDNARREAPALIRAATQIAVALAAILLAWRRRGWRLILALVALCAALAILSHVASRQGWWLSQTGLSVAAASGAVAGLAAGRRLLREAVRVYAGEAVAEEVSASGRLSPLARRTRATVLFTDARGFTAWSETRTPEEVALGLNRYFAALAAIAARHGGEVNKLAGDAMLVLFLADKAGDHAARAVAAVREMLALQGELRTSAGLHTGDVVMGVIGSGDKLEYTALGDAVNVAARLESLNREVGTRVLMSEATRAEAGLTARPVGCFVVKGRRAPVEACTLEEGE